MAQQKVVVVREFSRPVEAIFAELADHNNLKKVFGIPVKRIQDGQGDVNGVGSTRRMGLFHPLAVDETVVAVSPNSSIDYVISKGGYPIRNHHGRLDFSATGKGSRVQWVIEFDSLPGVGPVLKFVLGQALGVGLKRLG